MIKQFNKLVGKCWRWIIGDWWVVRRCEFPYAAGYATYNPYRKTVLDTGLSKTDALAICKGLNQ